ncbi:DNA topoisomerase 1A [Leishmania mexicana MHOM/GT/2001/U1103]|uniref:DNA topoisomerase n=1 Tax=Leishmania mexicana (strain MHOM/GT/2001/U1103) TaxID=929439 RepID=E9AUX9_LEIMU|nr:DNA topoisomerase 1A [Leishmania mexicana MHOM/GT/2001/U1103]CBZ26760.1 DNA topoisomerase 1A [Leishmania mexicana MHOM/GT/2001/U1103]
MLRRGVRALEKLVIVESPNKVIKVEGLLSDPKVIPDWSFSNSKLRAISTGAEKAIAMATTGHFMSLKELTWSPQPSSPASGVTAADFPANGLVVSFSLEWELIPGRRIQDTVSHYIEEKADNLTEIIVATDPDREGELIAVHAQNLIRRMFPQLNVPFTRAYMHSITAEGIRRAMEERREAFDYNLANAAEARHAMDRIFGFLGSSVVRYANPQMRSIGRVQTPALILINDREDKIKSYLDSHASTFEIQAVCYFTSKHNRRFSQMVKVTPGRKGGAAPVNWSDKATVEQRCEQWALSSATHFSVSPGAKPQETVTPPPKPFTMATLIARANRQLHYSSDMVSSCLQDLFQMGYITYPRTDSTRIDESILPSIYAAVRREHGKRLLQEQDGPSKPGSRRSTAQKEAADANVEDAHEAIRPTSIDTTVEELGAVSTPMKHIYDLVRRNTMAVHMIPMKTERIVVLVMCRAANGEEVEFELQGKHVVEPGWSAAFRGSKGTVTPVTETDQDVEAVEDGGVVVPSISDDEFKAIMDVAAHRGGGTGVKKGSMQLESAQVAENRPSPPLPFSEGGLIEQLKNNGVGRPSTYPMIVKTLLARNYITVNKGRCETTPVGRMLVDTSRATFPSIVDIGFTSAFEKKLDRIAKPGSAKEWALPPNVSDADYVLSSFISNFLNYVTEATKAHRVAIATRSLTLQQEKRAASAMPMSPTDFQANLEKEAKRVVTQVPDLVDNMKSYRTFTALQNSLNDYLRRNFPPSAAAMMPASSSGTARSYGRSSSSSTKKKGSYGATYKADKKTPRRFRTKLKKPKK